MIKRIEFNLKYEPGENQPPQFKTEYRSQVFHDEIPRFKDWIVHDKKKYRVWDVVFNYDVHGASIIDIMAVRDVQYPEFSQAKGEVKR